MARSVKPFVSVTGKDVRRGRPVVPVFASGFERLLSCQRPAVIAHIERIRRKHPDTPPQQVIRTLERRYLAAVTLGGAAVGATAAIPGIGTAGALGVVSMETVAFLETTALFAQSVSEVHGIPVEDPERARLLVMATMLGPEGTRLVQRWSGHVADPTQPPSQFWGETLTSTLPPLIVSPLSDKLKTAFAKKFAVTGSKSVLGKALPLGIGAAIGGVGNHVIGRRVITTAQSAFPPLPEA